MIQKSSSLLFEKAFVALQSDLLNEKSKIISIFKKIITHPIKIIAAFIFAPILIVKIAFTVENRIRRWVAIIGLLFSLLCSYFAGTFLGSLVGAAFVTFHVGILTGIGFLFGTMLSIILSVIFSIIVLNSVSFLFLKIGSQEVINYLHEFSI